MRLRKVFLLNHDSGMPHAFVGSQSMCGQVDLRRTATIFSCISRKRAVERGLCKKCQKALERDRRLEMMEDIVEHLANRVRED